MNCIPVKHQSTARARLIKREGPAPFEGAICRHLCENDSRKLNGFVCSLHTTWGTQKENIADQGEGAGIYKMSRESKSKGGVKSGTAAMTNPNHSCRQQVECPHCGKVGMRNAMLRWHFDRCSLHPL